MKKPGLDNESKIDSFHDTGSAHEKQKSYLKEGLFLMAACGMGILSGFGMTLSRVKRRNPVSFSKGVLPDPGSGIVESGAALGARALAWGTVYAVLGVGSLTFLISRIAGINSFEDLKERCQISGGQRESTNETTSVTLNALFDGSSSETDER